MSNIRRRLPELERARLQLQSPLPSNPASPKPSNPDTPSGIQGFQASKHPRLHESLIRHLNGVTAPSLRAFQAGKARAIPHSTILKGTHFPPAGVHRAFLDADLEPPPPAPLALKLVLPPAQECQMAHLTGNRHPSIQASEHPGIQASIPPARGCKMDHLTSNRHPSSQASEHPGIHASGPEVGGRGGSL